MISYLQNKINQFHDKVKSLEALGLGNKITQIENQNSVNLNSKRNTIYTPKY